MAEQMGVHEEYFDTLDEEKAYLLGYLFADASIYRGTTGRRHEIIISSDNREMLELIKQRTGAQNPIRPRPPGSYQMRIGSRHMAERLHDLGLTEDKKMNLIYPELPADLEKHFIRGYFEGKGSFVVEPGRRIISCFSSACPTFMEALRDRLILYGLSAAQVLHNGPDDCSHQLRYYVKDTRKLYHVLYDEARIYSSDKRSRYEGGYRI
jgi:hypothetical protein